MRLSGLRPGPAPILPVLLGITKQQPAPPFYSNSFCAIEKGGIGMAPFLCVYLL